jgi:hypothetical protein
LRNTAWEIPAIAGGARLAEHSHHVAHSPVRFPSPTDRSARQARPRSPFQTTPQITADGNHVTYWQLGLHRNKQNADARQVLKTRQNEGDDLPL